MGKLNDGYVMNKEDSVKHDGYVVTMENGKEYAIRYSEFYDGREYVLAHETDKNEKTDSKMKAFIVACDSKGTYFQAIEDEQEHHEMVIQLALNSLLKTIEDAKKAIGGN